MLKKSFEKLRKLLEKDIKRLGIDLINLDDSDYEPPAEPETFSLYNLAMTFSKKIERLMKDMEEIPIDIDKNLILDSKDVLNRYLFLFPTKIYRALTSRTEEEKDKYDKTMDAKTSVFIAVNELLATAQALRPFHSNFRLCLV